MCVCVSVCVSVTVHVCVCVCVWLLVLLAGRSSSLTDTLLTFHEAGLDVLSVRLSGSKSVSSRRFRAFSVSRLCLVQ